MKRKAGEVLEMRLKNVMEESYRNLMLVPNFYHKWDFAIHVELGGRLLSVDC